MSPDSIGQSVADQSFKFVRLGAFNRTPILSTEPDLTDAITPARRPTSEPVI